MKKVHCSIIWFLVVAPVYHNHFILAHCRRSCNQKIYVLFKLWKFNNWSKGSFSHFRHESFRHESFSHESFSHELFYHESFSHESFSHGSFRHESFRHVSFRHESFRHESFRHESFSHENNRGAVLSPEPVGLVISQLEDVQSKGLQIVDNHHGRAPPHAYVLPGIQQPCHPGQRIPREWKVRKECPTYHQPGGPVVRDRGKLGVTKGTAWGGRFASVRVGCSQNQLDRGVVSNFRFLHLNGTLFESLDVSHL